MAVSASWGEDREWMAEDELGKLFLRRRWDLFSGIAWNLHWLQCCYADFYLQSISRNFNSKYFVNGVLVFGRQRGTYQCSPDMSNTRYKQPSVDVVWIDIIDISNLLICLCLLTAMYFFYKKYAKLHSKAKFVKKGGFLINKQLFVFFVRKIY